MILSDNMKRLIDTLNTYEPDLPNGFYSVKVLQDKLDFTAQFVLESLANDDTLGRYAAHSVLAVGTCEEL